MSRWGIAFISIMLLGFVTTVHSEPQPAADKSTHVIMETSMGNIELKFFPDVAPKGVENFLTHVKNGYYDNSKFHRIVKGFVIQGEDPTNRGNGGESIWGEPFDVEWSPTLTWDRAGLLGYANSGPKTNRSQFYITLAPAHHLDHGYTIFGEVVAGLDVVQKINSVPTDAYERPVDPAPMLLKAFIKPESTPVQPAVAPAPSI